MDTKETIAELFPGNESMAALVDELGLELKEKTLLECFEEVIDYAQHETTRGHRLEVSYSFDEGLMRSKKLELDRIAREYGITNTQAALLALLIEMTKGHDVDKQTLTSQLEMKYISFLQYDKDLYELQKKRLLVKCRWGNYRIQPEVIENLAQGKAYHMPPTEGISTSKILARMSRLFESIRDNEEDIKLVLSGIDDMFLSNPQTSIAKTADELEVVKAGDVYEEDPNNDDNFELVSSMDRINRMLFYALIYRYYGCDDDDCGWWDFKDFFDEDDFDDVQTQYKDGELQLLKKNVIEYVNADGMVVKDRFHLRDEVKEKLFADVGGLHDRMPQAGMMLSGSIAHKELFYDESAQRQVDSMAQLLSEERYNEVRNALKDKGLRSGFTCLFYGSPGTGKTETVLQLARQTGRDIIMADVSKLKSCWVGESEKNVKNLFSMYRRCVKESGKTPILLFNEADAIFGIRMEGAARAVDKMENSLQNIILQEMENLDGILIATTNLTQNLDKAFERRFLYKVKFDVPSTEVKSKIWLSMMPELDRTQAQGLSQRFDFSGGQIENVSRKRMVQSIISGAQPSFEDLVAFCEEELIGGKGQERRRIGF